MTLKEYVAPIRHDDLLQGKRLIVLGLDRSDVSVYLTSARLRLVLAEGQ